MVDPRPTHQRITAELRALIMDGSVTGKLPSAAALTAQFGVTNPTITKALKALHNEGLTDPRPGTAVFVLDREPPPVGADPFPAGLRYTAVKIEPVERPPGDVAAALGGDQLMVCVQLGYDGYTPVELRYTYLPLDVGHLLDVRERTTLPDLPALLTEAGTPPRAYLDDMTVREPTSAELESLQLPADISIVRTLRTYSAGKRVLGVDEIYIGAHDYRTRRAGRFT